MFKLISLLIQLSEDNILIISNFQFANWKTERFRVIGRPVWLMSHEANCTEALMTQLELRDFNLSNSVSCSVVFNSL